MGNVKMMIKTGLYCLFFLFFSLSMIARDFKHPGLLHSQEDLNRIKQLVKQAAYPAMGSYELLKKSQESSYNYEMKGPFENISRAGKYGYTKYPCESDCNAAYYNSLMWNITNDVRHADKAMEILRGYAGTLQKIHGPDDPLCAGLQGFMLINAAEIMRYTYSSEGFPKGWTDEDTHLVERMLRGAFLPVLKEFYEAPPYSNGNWGIAVTKAMIGIAVFLDDEALYEEAINFFYHGEDNGSLPNYIASSGQIQESGRDQAHCMLGVGCLAEIAEVAWSQGDDLYATFGNRIMKGCEYLSKSNLGYEVPFFTWKDKTGKYSNWRTLGQAGLGEFRAVFELPYNHYTERCHLSMPYTRMVLGCIRPEGAGFTCDNPGFGSLLFYLGEGEALPKKGQVNEILSESLCGWKFANAGWRAEEGKLVLKASGTACSKTGIMYDAAKYPYLAVKISKMPSVRNKAWLRLSYSVMSAPEFWTFSEKDARRVGEDTYVFTVPGSRSNNGTEFSTQPVSMTLYLDFGETQGEGVGVEWVRSLKSF